MIVRVTLVCFLLVVVGSPIKSNAEAEAEACPRPRPRARPVPIYSNQFAVHVPEGFDAAAEIAEKHGFDNHGQIGSLKNYFLFSHKRLNKRSLTESEPHHKVLRDESRVHWFQQQHEKKRKKRDFEATSFATFGDYPPFFDDFGPRPRQASYHRQRNRGVPFQNLFTDPLFKEQWYLNGGAKDGYDMNLGPAWQKGYTGKGVVVSILDDGIQTNHPDLALNYDHEASYDINDNDSDPMPRDNGDNKHGTRCAGEVAAVAFNQYCGVGVAYNSSIGGVRMLDGPVNDAVEARALGLNPDHIDIYSASWGPEDDGKTVDGPGPLARRAFIYGVTSGRKGKGSIFVWASGNGGRHTDSCNCDGYTNSIFTLSISSATQGGYKPWYLEECSSTLASTYSSGTPGNDKSVATVDMDAKLRPDHICTVEHTGTSASAPLAAGIAALALEANPSLTWRDMQYLVVLTSRSEPLEKEPGWILNGVKRKVSHKFGYGLMDAGAMVSLAEQWTNVAPQHICKSDEINEERPIDPTYGYTLSVYMDVTGCAGSLNEVRFLEHVQCKVSLRFFPRGNLRLLLTSPMGTTSTLLFERPRDVLSSSFDDWPFLSVHFWGEKADGRWTLQIINAGNRHVNSPGILKKWQLIFYGTATNPIRIRTRQFNPSYQGPYAGAASNVHASVATLDGSSAPLLTNRLPGDTAAASAFDSPSVPSSQIADGSFDTTRQILHNCDPQCDSQGCYGKGPTQCVACKNYRLDNTCVSRCPPRSFPNQGGVCWPCHESCEICAGAGQDSCLSCAPAHLRVTDLAVCLQQCPEGYYENTENSTCVPCEANCASCQDRPDKCTSCEHHLVMHENNRDPSVDFTEFLGRVSRGRKLPFFDTARLLNYGCMIMANTQTPGMDPWVIQPRERAKYQEQFDSLRPINGIITGEQAKGLLLRSQLPPVVLGQIWSLSDTDADGKMDINEFCIACKLITLKLRGFEIPKTLPSSLIQSLKASSTGNLATGLTNGAATIPTQNNITSLVNLTGTGAVPVQPLVGIIPVSTPPARPLIGPPSNGTIGRPSTPASPMTLPASRQNRQNVASNIHATTHTPSKPPARPAPPSVGIVPSASTPSTGPPQRPTPPSSIGSNFPTATNVPPPKPAPPSFPNSPVAAMSPAKVLPTAATAIVPPIQPMQSMATSAIGAPTVAPIAPLNTNPTPIAAFGMGQTMPMQPLCTGMVAPMTGGSTIMSSIPPLTTGTGVVSTPPVVGLPLVSSTTSGVPPVNGTTVHTPVSTCTPLSTTARPPSIDRVGSVDSQHSQHSVGSPQSVEWAVPHQTKLKYTQLFNTWDRTRSGFLSGPQARNIMVQSELPQPILARIWALADMDSDGRLGCDEFVLAMHLCDLAKGGEQIPNTLPLELIPPIFRRQRQGSLTQSQGSVESIDPSAGMPQTSFEDKRKENFEKGQAELERRRKALLEIQRKEQEERERKEREEAEKQEKIRLEQERRRQAEIEKQMLRQKEIEQEKEEQRKRAHEQREAARKEMERQRHLEWEKQKSQELQAQRQKEQDVLLKLKAKNQTLTIELGTLNDKVKELSQKICDTRVGVSSVKTTIDGMRLTRDSQLQEMTALKNKLREQNQRLLALSQEKARIEAKNKLNSAQDTVGQEAIKMAFDNKQITLKQMKDKIADMQQQIDAKMTDIENNNGQLEDIKTQMKNLIADCKKLYITFEDKKTKVLELKVSNGTGAATDYTASAWGDDSWGDTETIVRDNDWPVNDTAIITNTTEKPNAEVMKYRALYEFVARNQDEISFQPGDIILVPPVQNAEPGWMAGEIRGHTGWFPESYVEPIDSSATTDSTFMQQDSVEKRILEGIAEVPENVSDAGSLGGEAPTVEAIVPTLGLGVACNIQATALYQYRPTTEQHLSFDKEDTINVIEQQNNWWYGELSNGTKGWFPKSYVKETTTNDKDIVASVDDGLNEYYIALYQYASAETGDLSFNQNEVILVIKKEGDWWTGCIGDRTGIFPSNYVEKCDAPIQGVPLSTNATEQNTAVVTNTTENQEDTTLTTTQTPSQLEKTPEQLEDERAAAEDRAELPDFTAMATQQRGRKPEIVQVIAPYQATSAEQLDLQRGQLIMIRKKTDSGWWEGELQARGKKRQVGWFPASYVKPLTSSSNRSTPVSHGYQDSPTDPNVERVMALYPYQAQNEDELTFEKGDVITVIAKDEETWWKGELNGVSGLFPSNYVSPMS